MNRHWGAEEAKWRFLLTQGRGFGIDGHDGNLIGSVIVTGFGSLASISMVLVAAEYEGRGLGRALMEHAIAQAADMTVTLYATERGKPLYEKLGFRSVARAINHVGLFDPLSAIASRRALESDLPSILEMDSVAFGADRGLLLRGFSQFASHLKIIDSVGYAGAWHNNGITLIGPVVAADLETAQQLISDIAREIEGPIRLDISDGHPELAQWAYERGLRPNFVTDIMVLGDGLPGDRDRLFLPMMQALG